MTDTMRVEPVVLPCPFCGFRAQLGTDCVYCMNPECGLQFSVREGERLLESWNERPKEASKVIAEKDAEIEIRDGLACLWKGKFAKLEAAAGDVVRNLTFSTILDGPATPLWKAATRLTKLLTNTIHEKEKS